ncbi:hypothetical protein AGMMS50218_15310 [Actinomycetota bacterium]|nr:hypothetical protein AGMMS50218_15310 [Actinomycetota bacterium]
MGTEPVLVRVAQGTARLRAWVAPLRIVAGAWTGVLAWSGLLAQATTVRAAWAATWVGLGVAVAALTRVTGRVRVVVWALVHAGSHLCWLTAHPGGWAITPFVVVALAASLALSVATRPARWLVWTITVLAVVSGAGRVGGVGA